MQGPKVRRAHPPALLMRRALSRPSLVALPPDTLINPVRRPSLSFQVAASLFVRADDGAAGRGSD